jgi:hypothetical protein
MRFGKSGTWSTLGSGGLLLIMLAQSSAAQAVPQKSGPPGTASPAPTTAEVARPDPDAPPPSTSLDRLRSDDVTGKVKDIERLRGITKIAPPPPLAPRIERPALRTASALQTSERSTAAAATRSPALNAEIEARSRELEACRTSATRGPIELHWRIQPDGRASNALALQEQITDLEMLKCARKRMEAWRFTPPGSGPIDVEIAYDFARRDRLGRDEMATANPTPPSDISAGEASEAKKPAEIAGGGPGDTSLKIQPDTPASVPTKSPARHTEGAGPAEEASPAE